MANDGYQDRIITGQAINIAIEYVLNKDKEYDTLAEFFDRVDLHARPIRKFLVELQNRLNEEAGSGVDNAKDLKVDTVKKKLIVDI